MEGLGRSTQKAKTKIFKELIINENIRQTQKIHYGD